ncbi:MAG TPA: VOC family protein [Streptosporangiaceae bacterium]|jgi:catechol 2,3-dioxygenase-like lactoylglutathione lyase family enzyme
MAGDARLGSVVMFVQELDRSVAFYEDVLGLELVDRDPTAALLASKAGSQLILREMGGNAVRPLGGVGIQYVIWSAAGKDDLDRCEQVLKRRQAHRETRTAEGSTAVEGRDPDDVVVMIAYPGPDQAPMSRLPARIYGW